MGCMNFFVIRNFQLGWLHDTEIQKAPFLFLFTWRKLFPFYLESK